MDVGALAEEVVVTGRAELLQTQSADIGSVIDAQAGAGPAAARAALLRAGVPVAGRGRRAGGHHQPRRGHVLQRQRQLRHLEQLHARRRRQQFVLDQPPGAQPAGGAAAGGCAAGIQGPDAHLLGGVRQGGGRGDQRVGEAGHQQVQRLAVRLHARRSAQRQHLGQQSRRPREGAVQPADRRRHASAGRSSPARRSSSATTSRRGPNARCRRRRRCRRRGCAPATSAS